MIPGIFRLMNHEKNPSTFHTIDMMNTKSMRFYGSREFIKIIKNYNYVIFYPTYWFILIHLV